MRKFYYPEGDGDGDKKGGGGEKPKEKKPPSRIPLPNYKDKQSRLKYAEEWRKKYGPLMAGYGDVPLRVNEQAYKAKGTSKVIATEAAKKFGIDPALLYSSAMVEGMSGGFWDDEKGVSWARETPDFPIQGSALFGLDNFWGRFPEFVKKGYLPESFKSQFTHYIPTDEKTTKNSANFKTVDDALLATGAFMKAQYDDIDEYAKKKNIKLSPAARDFFALIGYNAGEGNSHQMLVEYNDAGYLKGDAFLKKRPTSGGALKAESWQVPYENVIRRIQMRDALYNEGLWEKEGEVPQQKTGAPTGYAPLNPQQRGDWNKFLDFLNKEDAVQGLSDPNEAMAQMKKFNTANPGSTINHDMVPYVQYEQQQLRNGEEFAGITGEKLQKLRSGLSPAFMERDISAVDGWMGPKTAMQYYPTAMSQKDGKFTNHGTNLEEYLEV